MKLSKNTNTPIPYFMSLPLPELHDWILTNNEIIREENERIKKQNEERRMR